MALDTFVNKTFGHLGKLMQGVTLEESRRITGDAEYQARVQALNAGVKLAKKLSQAQQEMYIDRELKPKGRAVWRRVTELREEVRGG